MRIEFLYFKTCPSYKLALERLQAVLKELDVDAQVDMIEVKSANEARQLCFLGSPTIRINGLDVEQTARSRTSYGLTCRMYETDAGLEGSPSIETIRDAVFEHLRKKLE